MSACVVPNDATVAIERNEGTRCHLQHMGEPWRRGSGHDVGPRKQRKASFRLALTAIVQVCGGRAARIMPPLRASIALPVGPVL